MLPLPTDLSESSKPVILLDAFEKIRCEPKGPPSKRSYPHLKQPEAGAEPCGGFLGVDSFSCGGSLPLGQQ